MKVQLSICSLFCLACFAWTADPPMPFTGKVVKITDGDMIVVLLNNEQHKIQLNGLDCPASRLVFGTKAKTVLGDRVLGKDGKVVGQ